MISQESWIPLAETNETAPTVPTSFRDVSAVTVLAEAEQDVPAVQIQPTTRQPRPVYRPTKSQRSEPKTTAYDSLVPSVNPVFKASTTSKPRPEKSADILAPEQTTSSADHRTVISSGNYEAVDSNDQTKPTHSSANSNDLAVIGQQNTSTEGPEANNLSSKHFYSNEDAQAQEAFRVFSKQRKDMFNGKITQSQEIKTDSGEHETGPMSTFISSLFNSILTKRQLGGQPSTHPPGPRLYEARPSNEWRQTVFQPTGTKLPASKALVTQLPDTPVPRQLVYGRPRQLPGPEVNTFGSNVTHHIRLAVNYCLTFYLVSSMCFYLGIFSLLHNKITKMYCLPK